MGKATKILRKQLDDDEEMGIEKIQTKRIRKTEKLKRGQPTAEVLEQRKQTADKKREAIWLHIKNKNKVKHTPGLLKDFNDRFETESKKILTTGIHSHNQKKRLKKKVKNNFSVKSWFFLLFVKKMFNQIDSHMC